MNWDLKQATVLISHPDDETIFMGGTLLTYPNCEWRVYCLTYNLEDEPRGTQFAKAMQMYKDAGVNIVEFGCLGHKDSLEPLTEAEKESWKSSIKGFPGTIFTHNSVGEYRHDHHIFLNKIVNEVYTDVVEFICPAMWRKQTVFQPFKSQTKIVPLTSEVLEKKNEIFNYSYPSEINNWRSLNKLMTFEFCSGMEIFTYE